MTHDLSRPFSFFTNLPKKMKQFIYFARFLKKYLLLQICYSIIGILCYFGGLCLNSLEFKFAGIGCITKVFTDIHRRRNRGKGGGLWLFLAKLDIT